MRIWKDDYGWHLRLWRWELHLTARDARYLQPVKASETEKVVYRDLNSKIDSINGCRVVYFRLPSEIGDQMSVCFVAVVFSPLYADTVKAFAERVTMPVLMMMAAEGEQPLDPEAVIRNVTGSMRERIRDWLDENPGFKMTMNYAGREGRHTRKRYGGHDIEALKAEVEEAIKPLLEKKER